MRSLTAHVFGENVAQDPACPKLSGKSGPQCDSKTPGFKPGCPDCLPWWKENHPDLVLYQCDKVTPCWECFSGEGCRHDSVPLDLTNPKTLEYMSLQSFCHKYLQCASIWGAFYDVVVARSRYQMSSAVLPAAKAGYNAIALDNYGLTNVSTGSPPLPIVLARRCSCRQRRTRPCKDESCRL